MVMSVLRIKFFTEFDKEDVLLSRLCIKCPLKTHYQLLEFTNSMLGSNGKKKGFLFSVSKIYLRISLACSSGYELPVKQSEEKSVRIQRCHFM